MLPKLSSTEPFKKEYALWEKQINVIKDSEIKNDLKKDLKAMLDYANQIDIGHSSEFNGMINPSLVSDVRNNLNELRLQIKNKLKRIKLQ